MNRKRPTGTSETCMSTVLSVLVVKKVHTVSAVFIKEAMFQIWSRYVKIIKFAGDYWLHLLYFDAIRPLQNVRTDIKWFYSPSKTLVVWIHGLRYYKINVLYRPMIAMITTTMKIAYCSVSLVYFLLFVECRWMWRWQTLRVRALRRRRR